MTPTDMVLVFLVTKPLFLLATLFLLWRRGRAQEQQRRAGVLIGADPRHLLE